LPLSKNYGLNLGICKDIAESLEVVVALNYRLVGNSSSFMIALMVAEKWHYLYYYYLLQYYLFSNS